jgi:hypothetical protein
MCGRIVRNIALLHNRSLLCRFIALSRAAGDPLTGSSFSDGTLPKNMTIVIDLNFSINEFNYHSVNNTNKGKPSGTHDTAKLNWKVSQLANNDRYNQVAVRRLKDREFEVLELKDRDVIVGAVYELLPERKRFLHRGIAKAPDSRSREYKEP